MANDEDVEFLNDQDIVLSIGEHINELQEIATEIAEHKFLKAWLLSTRKNGVQWVHHPTDFGEGLT